MPLRARAVVPRHKLTDYLLALTHPVGGAKARLFAAMGFDLAEPGALERALLDLAVTGVVSEVIETGHGTKYVVDGQLTSPTDRSMAIRTVWIIEREVLPPRLVTAYPS